MAGNLEAAARRGLEVHVRVDVEQADAFDAVIIDPPVDRTGVEALVQVGDDDRLRVEARRAQPQIIAENAAVRIGEDAVETYRGKRAAGDRVEPANPRRAPGDGDEIGRAPGSTPVTKAARVSHLRLQK